MLVLFETAAGYALFQVLNEGKLETPEELWKAFETPQEASNTIKLKAFKKFENMASAVSSISDVSEGKLSDDLNNFLKETIGETSIRKEKLIVADPKLGSTINKKLGIQVQSEKIVIDLFRGIRQHIDSLITGMDPDDISSMALGLSHSLSRHKLKFSPDKVDTMIIQAIGLLDDLDKELNTYAMRVKEWYGWHFPEMSKIVVDNLAYAKVVKAMGFRVNAQECDLSDILPEELENEVKEAAEISMGTEISEEDINNIVMGCDQVISLTAYRTELYEYLKNRMLAIAPNLTTIVGELVGARLISHAGSLLNLAKHPSSTIQILGAEKALFRALKTKNATPKYGLIYHASLVGQASPKNKGKIARIVASKSSLATRFDAIADEKDLMAEMGQNCRKMIETRLRILEKGGTIITTDKRKKQPKFELISTKPSYNPYADIANEPVEAGPSGTKAEESEESDDKMDTDSDDSESESLSKSEGKKPVKMQIEPIASDKKKEKKRKKPEKHVSDDEDLSKKMTASIIEESVSDKKKEKKKKKSEKHGSDSETLKSMETTKTEEPVSDKKKEKKKKKAEKHVEDVEDLSQKQTASVIEESVSDKKKEKKKKKSEKHGSDVESLGEELVSDKKKEKKKKKSEKHGSDAESIGEESVSDKKKEKKKKKSEKHESDTETREIATTEEPVFDKKKEKKKKAPKVEEQAEKLDIPEESKEKTEKKKKKLKAEKEERKTEKEEHEKKKKKDKKGKSSSKEKAEEEDVEENPTVEEVDSSEETKPAKKKKKIAEDQTTEVGTSKERSKEKSSKRKISDTAEATKEHSESSKPEKSKKLKVSKDKSSRQK